VFGPLCALTYTIFCFGLMLESWGLRGESKPWWFELAFVFAIPGIFVPPYIGAPLWGGAIGFALVRLVRWSRGRLVPSAPNK
jgi:hypothetical protein